jgi:hypothetical protein
MIGSHSVMMMLWAGTALVVLLGLGVLARHRPWVALGALAALVLVGGALFMAPPPVVEISSDGLKVDTPGASVFIKPPQPPVPPLPPKPGDIIAGETPAPLPPEPDEPDVALAASPFQTMITDMSWRGERLEVRGWVTVSGDQGFEAADLERAARDCAASALAKHLPQLAAGGPATVAVDLRRTLPALSSSDRLRMARTLVTAHPALVQSFPGTAPAGRGLRGLRNTWAVRIDANELATAVSRAGQLQDQTRSHFGWLKVPGAVALVVLAAVILKLSTRRAQGHPPGTGPPAGHLIS